MADQNASSCACSLTEPRYVVPADRVHVESLNVFCRVDGVDGYEARFRYPQPCRAPPVVLHGTPLRKGAAHQTMRGPKTELDYLRNSHDGRTFFRSFMLYVFTRISANDSRTYTPRTFALPFARPSREAGVVARSFFTIICRSTPRL